MRMHHTPFINPMMRSHFLPRPWQPWGLRRRQLRHTGSPHRELPRTDRESSLARAS